jgi:NAD(P)-dependent dehydrogenase (short-subunit alcohol dehydrogenase family)
MTSRLDARVAIAKGAAYGIGLGIAQLFIKEGAKVCFQLIINQSKLQLLSARIMLY